MSVGENGGHLSDFTQKKNSLKVLLETTPPVYLLSIAADYKVLQACLEIIRFWILFPPAYRLMIVDRPVLCHLRMNTRGCGRRGWGSRPNPRARPGRALWHKEGSVGPPQFDAVVGHASKNLGVWLCNTVFQLQPDALIFKKSDKFNQFWRRLTRILPG